MLTEISLKELCKFLVNAKINTYAGDKPRSLSKSILSKNYLYIENDWRYEDQYFGEIIDVGEEIVWYKEIPVWGMGYRGGVFVEYIEFKVKAFEFLRSALQKPVEQFPTRGPAKLANEEFSYTNETSGNILSFTGYEAIKLADKQIYFRNYIGGIIRGKFNSDMQIVHDL